MQKFQALGLQVAYRSDEEAKQFLHTIAALAFVPTRFVGLGWQGIKASAPTHVCHGLKNLLNTSNQHG